jgi:hypothetical protein
VEDTITAAMHVDRYGSAVLEELLKSNSYVLQGYTSINLQETIVFGVWYIWWTRRRITHGELIPPVHHRAMSIKGIVANSKVANKPNTEFKRV